MITMLTIRYLVYGELLLILISLYVTHRLVLRIRNGIANRRLEREWQCQPTRKLETGVLGIRHLLKILKEMKSHTVLSSIQDRFQRIGHNTYGFSMLGTPLITTCEPDNIKTVLALDFEKWGVGPIRKSAASFVGFGIFLTDGPAWQHSRNVLRPIFNKSQLADMSILKQHTLNLMSKIPFDGTTVDLQPLFFQLSIDIASHVLLGESTNCLTSTSDTTPGRQMASAFQRCIEYFGKGGDIKVLGIGWPNRQYKRDCAYLHKYIDSVINTALTSKDDVSIKSPGGSDRHILLHDLIIDSSDVKQIRSELLNILLAGRDTTASLLSDLFYELSQHSDIFSRLRTEVLSLSDVPITYDLLKSLPYLRACMNECLRLHPVVPANARIALVDTTLPRGGGEDGKGKVFVPKGTLLDYCVWAMQRRVDLYGTSAMEFIPERWLDEDGKGQSDEGPDAGESEGEEGEKDLKSQAARKGIRPGWTYLPFNGGPRVCLGQNFALTEVSYVIVEVVRECERRGLVLEARMKGPWQEKVTVTAVGNACEVAFVKKDHADAEGTD